MKFEIPYGNEGKFASFQTVTDAAFALIHCVLIHSEVFHGVTIFITDLIEEAFMQTNVNINPHRFEGTNRMHSEEEHL